MLAQKNLVLGVSGSIAAFKSVEILRRLCQLEAKVTVVMTQNAIKFIAPLTFQTLSKQKTITNLFDTVDEFHPEHIALSQRTDLLLVAPATANLIGKFAAGVADDFITTLFLSVKSPILIAPAMNPAMYANPIMQRNIKILEGNGVEIIEPAIGEVACGDSGQGRLAEVGDIIDRVLQRLARKRLPQKQKILITAGPTREYIDPIRYISNASSGKMGFALAKAAYLRGAEVVLISGPTFLSPPAGITYIPIVTAQEMMKAIELHFPCSSIAIMTAAVCDFRPVHRTNYKIKKNKFLDNPFNLEQNIDILKFMGENKKDQILVGFAAETEDCLINAQAKLKEKNLDFICVNDVTQPGAGFEVDTNIVTIIDSQHQIINLPLMSKENIAERILDKVQDRLHH